MHLSLTLFTTCSLLAGVTFARSIPNARSTPDSATIPGLDLAQSQNARAIMDEAHKENLPTQACLAAIATALQESQLHVYANPSVPASVDKPHQMVGSNYDSVGLFQQRVTFYPNVAADMDPAQSAAQFFTAMKAVGGWETMGVSTLCQTVQKAQAGNLYGQRVAQAQGICKAGGFS